MRRAGGCCWAPRPGRWAMAGSARWPGRRGVVADGCDGVAELESGGGAAGPGPPPGAGRKRLAETDPGLVPALLALVEESSGAIRCRRCGGRPRRGNLAGELTAQGHPVSRGPVQLLREQGFSLQGNAKVAEGRQHPDRDGQFRYINEQAREHLAAGDPVISVDAKKKEQVGEYAQAGREWGGPGGPGEGPRPRLPR